MPYTMRKPRFCIAGNPQGAYRIAEACGLDRSTVIDIEIPHTPTGTPLKLVAGIYREGFQHMFAKTATLFDSGGVLTHSPLELAAEVLLGQINAPADDPHQSACDSLVADCLHFARFFTKLVVFIDTDPLRQCHQIRDALLYTLTRRSEVSDRILMVNEESFEEKIQKEIAGVHGG